MTCNNEAPQLNPVFGALTDEASQREANRLTNLRNEVISAFGDRINARDVDLEELLEELKNPGALKPAAKVSRNESTDNSAQITDLESRIEDAESKLSDKETEVASLRRDLKEANERKDDQPVNATAPATPAPQKLPPNIAEALRRMQLPTEDRDHIAVNERGTDVEKAHYEAQYRSLSAANPNLTRERDEAQTEVTRLKGELQTAKDKLKDTPKASAPATPDTDPLEDPAVVEALAAKDREIETLKNSKQFKEDEALTAAAAYFLTNIYDVMDLKAVKRKRNWNPLKQDRQQAAAIEGDEGHFTQEYTDSQLDGLTHLAFALKHTVVPESKVEVVATNKPLPKSEAPEADDTDKIETGALHK